MLRHISLREVLHQHSLPYHYYTVNLSLPLRDSRQAWHVSMRPTRANKLFFLLSVCFVLKKIYWAFSYDSFTEYIRFISHFHTSKTYYSFKNNANIKLLGYDWKSAVIIQFRLITLSGKVNKLQDGTENYPTFLNLRYLVKSVKSTKHQNYQVYDLNKIFIKNAGKGFSKML